MKLKTLLDIIWEEKNLRCDFERLLESPLKIKTWCDEKLDDNAQNFAFAHFVKNTANHLGVESGFDSYSYQVGKQVYDVYVSPSNFVVCLFGYIVNGNTMYEKNVWQDPMNFGLCRKILFDKYLKKFDRIVSDGLHSELGGKYWEKLMEQAESSGYKVYVELNGKSFGYKKENINDYYKSLNIKFVIEK